MDETNFAEVLQFIKLSRLEILITRQVPFLAIATVKALNLDIELMLTFTATRCVFWKRLILVPISRAIFNYWHYDQQLFRGFLIYEKDVMKFKFYRNKLCSS